VDDARNDFFSDAALADNEYAQVGRCHLQGDIEHSVQGFAVSYDVVPLFDAL
jgi:hypothetical protein